jgi:hypothetical protein
MVFSWLSFGQSSRSEPRRSSREEVRFRPTVERLEEREVPSANPLDALLGSVPGLVPIQFNYAANGQFTPGTQNQAGQLQYTLYGQVGANSLTMPLTLTATPGSNGAEILNLHINPIHLDVLGLNVNTSAICLNITAQQGSGNLLGNLLYDVAHALDPNGGNSSNPLGTLSPIENLIFSLELSTLLNGGVNAVTGPSSIGASSSAQNDQVLPPGATDILHLSLGPVNLNLLGLNVALNNCHNGPVVVDAYAQSGSGELLGNLLTDVANILNPNQNSLQAEQLLGNVVNTVLTAV